MASDHNQMYHTVWIADLNCQSRPVPISSLTTVDDVRREFGYGQWIGLYITATGSRIDGTLGAYRLGDRERLDFRMNHPVLKIWEYVRKYLASSLSADEERTKLLSEFHKQHPSGYLSKEEFFSRYGIGWYTDRRISDGVFDLFDTNGDGWMDDREWIFAASIMIAGPQRLRVTFSFFDKDGDGFISREELLRIVLPMYKLYRDTGQLGSLPHDENTPQKLVEKVFRYLDKNSDGKLSFHEFQRGYGQYPDVFQYISRFTRR